VESSEQSENLSLTSQHVIRHRPAFHPTGDAWPAQYEWTRDIGSGGQAQVYGARNALGHEVAIKVPHGKPAARDRFRREVHELDRSRHPHVMPLLDHGDGWYAMPIADGALSTLAPPLSEEERLEVIDHVAQGLTHAHSLGCCHRDVTPGNILRLTDSAGRRWVIGDFGLSRRPRGETTGPRTNGVLGTPGFEAPEMHLLGPHEVDQRADIYGLGKTIAFMVTGALPAQLAHVDIPKAWATLIDRMTDEARDERFQTMSDVRAALVDVARAIKQERIEQWKRPAGAGILKDHEIAVLAAMLDVGDQTVGVGHLERMLGRRKRELSLGLIELRQRDFITAGEYDHGEPWYELTPAGREWICANSAVLMAAPAAPPPGPTRRSQVENQPDDDIPF
jgi:serine/threonine protein kinase